MKTLKNIFNTTEKLPFSKLLRVVMWLSLPTILSQISSILMEYIDAGMVGNLGKNASASVGLVSSSIWLFGGLTIALSTGFSVQVAQLIGAGNVKKAREILKQSIITVLGFSIVISLIAASISKALPVWLGGADEIRLDSTRYYLIFACSIPIMQLRQLSGSMLQSSGDMKTPSILNAIMCLMDIVFNYFLIFPTHSIGIFGFNITIYGADLGVTGASLGTMLSELLTACIMLYAVCVHSPVLRLDKEGSWKPAMANVTTAAKIALPIAFEHSALCGAQIASTKIVAPLGTASVAANSLAVTAESFCYMPGYGIGSAATTLVGQSIGADRRDLARRFARISVAFGTAIMSLSAIIMYFIAPAMFALLTPVEEIRILGTHVLRIEAFAEPLYAVSIIVSGALRGAGDTLVPGILNLASMWGVRITSAALLAPLFGLSGVWIAMCGELCIRGILFLIRLLREKWLNKTILPAS